MTPEELHDRLTTVLPAGAMRPFPAAPGEVVILVEPAAIAQVLRVLRDDEALAFEMLSDLTVVDYLGREPRFEVVYQLYSLTRNHRLRVKVPLPESEPVVPTASSIWKSALWAEREAWDQFGVRFAGHPDLRRLLNAPEFVGHPLRKDYPVDRRQVFVPERDPIERPWFPGMGRG